MRLGHVGFVFPEMGRLPTDEPEDVISSKSVSGNAA